MMFIATPSIGWALPLVWPIVLSLAGAMGYKMYTSTADDAPLRGQLNRELNNLRTVSIPLENVVKDMVADEVGREQVLRFTRDDIILVFKRDARGKFSVEVSGPVAMAARELERIGTEFAGALVQQFAFNKIAVELEKKRANVVGEEINEEGDIILRLRRWE